MGVRGLFSIAGLCAAVAACMGPAARSVSGEQTFVTHCASCHGATGAGDGPVAATLSVPVPDLRGLCASAGGVFPEDRVASYIDGRALPVAHGTRNMPVWGPVFATTHELLREAPSSDKRIDSVISHLLELQSGCGETG